MYMKPQESALWIVMDVSDWSSDSVIGHHPDYSADSICPISKLSRQWRSVITVVAESATRGLPKSIRACVVISRGKRRKCGMSI